MNTLPLYSQMMTPNPGLPQPLVIMSESLGNFRLGKAAKRVLVAHFLVGKKTSIRVASDHPPKEIIYPNQIPTTKE